MPYMEDSNVRRRTQGIPQPTLQSLLGGQSQDWMNALMNPQSNGIPWGQVDSSYQRPGPGEPSFADKLMNLLQGTGGFLEQYAPLRIDKIYKRMLGLDTEAPDSTQGGLGPLGELPQVTGGTNFQPGQMYMSQDQGLNPIQTALAQLDQLMNQGTGGLSEEDLQQALDEAAAGINKQYGAQIGAVRHQMGGARQDTKAGSREIQQMYAALARSYNKAGQREMRQGNRLSQRLQGMGEQAQEGITNQALKMNQQSVQAAKALGLADLGESLVGRTNKVAQNLGNVMSTRGNLAGETVLGQAGNNRTFMNTSGQTSRLEGTNRSADLYAQLQDYLQAHRDQIAELAGQKASALAASNAGITNSFASAQSDAQQQLIENKLALLQMAMDAQQQQFKQSTYQPEGQSQQDLYSLLPDQTAGPAAFLSQLGDPTVNKLYSQLSTSGPMGTGYYNSEQDGSMQSLPLQGNVANMQTFLQQSLGPQWNRLTDAERSALVNVLLLQIQGASTNKSSYQ